MSSSSSIFTYSVLLDVGPLFGGLIPNTLSRIALILSFVKPILLYFFALNISIASNKSGLNFFFTANYFASAVSL
jgi:hypothetical protein